MSSFKMKRAVESIVTRQSDVDHDPTFDDIVSQLKRSNNGPLPPMSDHLRQLIDEACDYAPDESDSDITASSGRTEEERSGIQISHSSEWLEQHRSDLSEELGPKPIQRAVSSGGAPEPIPEQRDTITEILVAAELRGKPISASVLSEIRATNDLLTRDSVASTEDKVPDAANSNGPSAKLRARPEVVHPPIHGSRAMNRALTPSYSEIPLNAARTRDSRRSIELPKRFRLSKIVPSVCFIATAAAFALLCIRACRDTSSLSLNHIPDHAQKFSHHVNMSPPSINGLQTHNVGPRPAKNVLVNDVLLTPTTSAPEPSPQLHSCTDPQRSESICYCMYVYSVAAISRGEPPSLVRARLRPGLSECLTDREKAQLANQIAAYAEGHTDFDIPTEWKSSRLPTRSLASVSVEPGHEHTLSPRNHSIWAWGLKNNK